AISRACASFVFGTFRPPPRSPLFPYTTLFRSHEGRRLRDARRVERALAVARVLVAGQHGRAGALRLEVVRDDEHVVAARVVALRSEEHTSELQSRENLVCRLLLEKKKRKNTKK